MYKYYVKISFPDMNVPTAPETTVVFAIYARNDVKAAERGYHWGVAIVKDILRHNKVNPYEIDLVAPELVKIIKCKLWDAGNTNGKYGSEGNQI